MPFWTGIDIPPAFIRLIPEKACVHRFGSRGWVLPWSSSSAFCIFSSTTGFWGGSHRFVFLLLMGSVYKASGTQFGLLLQRVLLTSAPSRLSFSYSWRTCVLVSLAFSPWGVSPYNPPHRLEKPGASASILIGPFWHFIGCWNSLALFRMVGFGGLSVGSFGLFMPQRLNLLGDTAWP